MAEYTRRAFMGIAAGSLWAGHTRRDRMLGDGLMFAHRKPQQPVGRQVFVSPSGNNANSGLSPAAPKQTLAGADAIALPGDTINVAAGSYAPVNITKSGTSTQRILWICTTRFGAVISSTTSYPMIVDGDYVDVRGFEITGPASSSVNVGLWLRANFQRAIACYVHDCPVPETSAGGAGILIEEPTTWTATGGQVIGCRIDRIGSATIGTGSTVHGIYWAQPDCVMVNNVVSNCAADGIQSWHAATRGIIVNNTVYNCRNGITNGTGETGATASGNQNTLCQNNVLVHNANTGIIQTSDGLHSVTGSQHINNIQWNNNYANVAPNDSVYNNSGSFGVTPSGQLIIDPLFVDAANGNFHIQSSSPAIGSGATGANVPGTDFDTIMRPSPPSRGAFEYVSVPAASWTVDQANLGTGDGGTADATSVALTTSATAAANSLIVVGVTYWGTTDGTPQVSSLSGGGLTWTEVTDVRYPGTGSAAGCAIYAAFAASGLASGTTITATLGSLQGFRRMVAASFLGGTAGVQSGQGTPSFSNGVGTAHSATMTTTSSGALLVGVVFLDDVATTNTPDANTTEDVEFAPTGSTTILHHRVGGAAGSYTLGGTQGVSQAWLSAIASFKVG